MYVRMYVYDCMGDGWFECIWDDWVSDSKHRKWMFFFRAYVGRFVSTIVCVDRILCVFFQEEVFVDLIAHLLIRTSIMKLSGAALLVTVVGSASAFSPAFV